MKRPIAIAYRTRLGVFVIGLVVMGSSPAFAGCTWKFDWYCSDCAKIGGRLTGTQEGYPSEQLCESARSQVKSPASSLACDRVGWCDEPRSQQPTTQNDSGGGTGGVTRRQPQPDYEAQRRRDEEFRRQEEARLQVVRDRRTREKKAFEKAKTDILGSLKGSNLDQDSGIKGTGTNSALQLKTSTPTFGIKGNPDGQLRLKDAEPVKLKNPEIASVNPPSFTRPKSRLHIRDVPNPMQAPKGTWERYIKFDRANLILDALEEGHGDLDLSIVYLENQITKHGGMRASGSALSYLEGLKTSYIAVGDEYRMRTKGDGGAVSMDSKSLLEAILAATELPKASGAENPFPGFKQPDKDEWRVERADKMLEALEKTPNDLERTYKNLQGDKDIFAAANAEHYLRGVYAYWDYLSTRDGK